MDRASTVPTRHRTLEGVPEGSHIGLPATVVVSPAPADETLDQKAPVETWICFAVNVLAFAAICALVVIRTDGFWYDESWYLASVGSLRHQGALSAEFLRGLPGPAGPLYAWIHYLLEPLTGLRPLPTRFATIFLFVLTVVVLSMAARASGIRFGGLRTPQLLGAPMIYGTVGTALTEVPAMFVFALHIAVLLTALRWIDRNRPAAVGLGTLAGLLCGLAVAGRQTFLASLLALPVLGWKNRRAWPVLTACALSSLILPTIIFAAWQGLTPPKIAYVGQGFSPVNVFAAFAYAGIVYAIYDFSWILEHARRYGAIVLTGLVLNLAFGLLEQTPLIGTASRVLPDWGMPLYTRLFSGLFLGWGLVFMSKLVTILRDQSRMQRYLAFASILILGSALKVSIPYGGRYIVGCVPLLLLLALHRAPDTRWKAARMAVAAVVGLASLDTFITDSLRLEDSPLR